MKYTFLAFLIVFTIISCGSDDTTIDSGDSPVVIDETVNEITYTASSEVISNPERGFMHSWSVASEGTPLSLVTLQSLMNENVTIILRLYYLDAFKNTDLSTTQLELIKTDLTNLREAGVKCVLRFAYNSDADDTDAPLSIIESHLDQLKSIFEDNADVISFVQAGFIGSWGEWAFTTNDLTTPANKAAVINKLLEVLPETIKIQLRTPGFKQEFFDTTTAIGTEIGYGTTAAARIGFHNDCFLASIDDYGTYEDVEIQKEYISQEAFFVPTGGETCPPSGIPTASCNTADAEMSLLKWTYLNLDYYGPVLNVWRNNSCFEDFQKQLGYRLLLKSAILKKEATVNGSFDVSSVVVNAGYAPVYNIKNSFLIFKSLTDDTIYKKELNFDVRKVLPEVDYELEESISLSGIPSGSYELYLKIEDGYDSLSDRPEYSIQLANTNTWNATDGFNDLKHTLIIN